MLLLFFWIASQLCFRIRKLDFHVCLFQDKISIQVTRLCFGFFCIIPVALYCEISIIQTSIIRNVRFSKCFYSSNHIFSQYKMHTFSPSIIRSLNNSGKICQFLGLQIIGVLLWLCIKASIYVKQTTSWYGWKGPPYMERIRFAIADLSFPWRKLTYM